MQAKITMRLVEGLTPQAKRYSVWDTEIQGFVVVVHPTGRRVFYVDYRNREGRRLKYKIGAFPGIKPDGARRIAIEAKGKIAARIDVQAEEKTARQVAARERASTLGAFIEQKYGRWAVEHLRRGDVAVARLKADFSKWLEAPLTSFNKWRIESWRRDRLKAGIKPPTINRQIDTLKAALQKAVEWEVIDQHPLRGLGRLKTGDDKRVRFLSAEEEQRLRDALIKRETALRESRVSANEWRAERHKDLLPLRAGEFVDHLRPLVLLALNTGLRRGELFSLRWSDINLKNANLTVRAAAAKSGQRRDVPLNVEAAKTLRSWQKQSEDADGDALVFPGIDGARLNNIVKSWETARKLAKLPGFRFHDLRHTFASKLVQRSVPLNTVRELMGHADIKMTLRYAHLAPGNLSSAVAQLG